MVVNKTEWHYELEKTPSGYYIMTIREGTAPWEIPYNEGYWISVKTVDGGIGKKWIRGKRPIMEKIGEIVKDKIIEIKNNIIFSISSKKHKI